jgi:hypothetical protein
VGLLPPATERVGVGLADTRALADEEAAGEAAETTIMQRVSEAADMLGEELSFRRLHPRQRPAITCSSLSVIGDDTGPEAWQ